MEAVKKSDGLKQIVEWTCISGCLFLCRDLRMGHIFIRREKKHMNQTPAAVSWHCHEPVNTSVVGPQEGPGESKHGARASWILQEICEHSLAQAFKAVDVNSKETCAELCLENVFRWRIRQIMRTLTEGCILKMCDEIGFGMYKRVVLYKHITAIQQF